MGFQTVCPRYVYITKLNAEIKRIVKRSDILRAAIDDIVAEIEGT